MARASSRRLLRFLQATGALLLMILTAAGITVHSVSPVDPSGPPQSVVVPRGATPADIGEVLQSAGLIRSAWVFRMAVRIKGVAEALQEGEYRLSPGMGLLEIVDALTRGDVVLRQVTIPEGFTAAEVVDVLAAAGIGNRARLELLVRHGAPSFRYAFLRQNPSGSLEGFLFPDTYRIPRHLADREIIALLLNRFTELVVPRWQGAASPRPLFEVVTVASLVEREARVASERAVIAGVLYNRLARGMRLEVDATVLYALGRHKSVVSLEDLKVDSPYNTYLYGGLPPGPIANPGLAAINAALYPAATGYLFYVARADGSHVFSRTFQEHLIAIKKYRGR